MAVQDIRVGGRQAASYQYTLLFDFGGAARVGSRKYAKRSRPAALADVNSDQQDNGAEMNLIYDRDTMSRLQVFRCSAAKQSVKYAFGQRNTSTIYQPMNQYKVVMEVDPRYSQISARWRKCLLSTATEKRSLCPMAARQCAAVGEPSGLFQASTIALNLPTDTHRYRRRRRPLIATS